MENRIKTAKQAIFNLRKKYGYDAHERGIAFGCIGVLEYIETGNIKRISHLDIQREVQKLNRIATKEKEE